MEKDIFCRIVDGEIPCYKVYEDEDVLAFLDISQVTKGHTLVIPKKHFETFLSVEKEILDKVMGVSQKLANTIQKLTGAKGINIITNCFPAAGQSVSHFHVHIIPRYDENDGLKMEFENHADGLDLVKLAEEIIKAN